ncbi:MAG: hypothetical protein V1493_05725, partial [Candidatus Diapherotrites archaeon]
MPKRPERYWETPKRRKPTPAPNAQQPRKIIPAQVLECIRLSRDPITAADIARTIGPGVTAGQVGEILDPLVERNLIERTDRKKSPPV